MKRGWLAALAVLGMAGAAHAASAPAPVSAASDFSGAYVGINGGYANGNFVNTTTPNETMLISGFVVGGQVGYNFVLSDNVVFGIQGDLDWSNVGGNYHMTTYTENVSTGWSGSATARLGLVTGSFMPYLLGGLAAEHVNETWYDSTAGVNGIANGTAIGWTVGLGAEAKVTDNLGAFLEGRYTSYANINIPGTWSGAPPYTWTLTGPQSDWSIRGGLNWHL